MTTVSSTIAFISNELTAASAGLDHWFDREEQLGAFKPANGGWSIDQILEHVVLTNHFLLILVEKGTKKALKKYEETGNTSFPADYELNSKEMQEIGTHGAFRWIRPEHMEPKGDRTLKELRETLRLQADQYRMFLGKMKNGEGILYRTTMTVNNLGKIDVYQYIYFLVMHMKRHLTQISKIAEEWKRSSGEN